MNTFANRGRNFEEIINSANERYRQRGTAVVVKVPTEFIPIRDYTGRVTGCKVTRKSVADYIGRWGNQPVAIEAKRTSGARIAFDRVEPHQAEFLNNFCFGGGSAGLGFVLLSFGERRFFCVPWPHWRRGMESWAKRIQGKRTGLYAGEMYLGWKIPAAGSVSVKELHPDWEVKLGGPLILPYFGAAGE